MTEQGITRTYMVFSKLNNVSTRHSGGLLDNSRLHRRREHRRSKRQEFESATHDGDNNERTKRWKLNRNDTASLYRPSTHTTSTTGHIYTCWLGGARDSQHVFSARAGCLSSRQPGRSPPRHAGNRAVPHPLAAIAIQSCWREHGGHATLDRSIARSMERR